MIRATLDTNVLVSGIIGFAVPDSTPGELLRLWRDDAFILVISDHIREEVLRTLSKPYFQARLSPNQISRLDQLLHRRAETVPLTVTVSGVATHPEDDLVLATAVSGSAMYLVTGDRKLQGAGTYQAVRIISPRAFRDELGMLGQSPDE